MADCCLTVDMPSATSRTSDAVCAGVDHVFCCTCLVDPKSDLQNLLQKRDLKKQNYVPGPAADVTGSMAPLRPLPTTAVPMLERGAVTVVKAEGYVARLGASNRLLGMPVFYDRQVMESGGIFKNTGT